MTAPSLPDAGSDARRLRIASLLPAATEIVVALGATRDLVAISHECDYPPEIRTLPRITASPVDVDAASARIDEAVRAAMTSGESVIGVDPDALRRADPDIILTQSQCEVCAADGRAVRALAAELESSPRLVTLAATDLAGVYQDIRDVGAAIERFDASERVVARMKERISGLGRDRPPPKGGRPRVVCIEWTDPPYLAGHWVPELIAAAGGDDVGAEPGEPSRRVDWADVEALRPDVLLMALCGFDEERSRRELDSLSDPIARRLLASTPTVVVDGNAYTSRPGPRLAEGAERIAAALATANMASPRVP